MKIVKYKINSDGTIPKEIDDGGYFRNPVTEEMVGFSNSDKLAIGQVELTELEFKTLVSDLDLKNLGEPTSMTTIEKETLADSYVTVKTSKLASELEASK